MKKDRGKGMKLIMMMMIIQLVYMISNIRGGEPTITTTDQKEIARFQFVDYEWESQEQQDHYMNTKTYEKVTLAGIKLDSDNNIYVSMPRWKTADVPATMGKYNANNGKIEAFPTWAHNDYRNKAGNVSFVLHSVLGFEIDAKDRMWIVDQGKVANQKAEEGSIQLIVYDLKTNTMVARHPFTTEEASPIHSFLNDIVVDTEKKVCYIADSGKPLDAREPLQPQLLRVTFPEMEVTSMNVSTFLQNDTSVMAEDHFEFRNATGIRCDALTRTGIDGIALSCDGSMLYYTPLSGRHLYSLETIFFDEDPDDVALWVQAAGNKGSASDGLSYGSDYYVYMTMLETNQVARIHHEELPHDHNSTMERMEVIAENLKWPDTLGWGKQGLYILSNDLCTFLSENTNWDAKDNFVITMVPLESQSYTQGCQLRSRRFSWPEIMLVVVGVSLFVSMLLCVIPLSCIWRYRYAFFKTRQPMAQQDFDDEEIEYDVAIY